MKDTSSQIASKTSALAVMASRFSVDPSKLLDTLKNTVFKGATNDELFALVVVSNEYGLNPLTKEIYAFPAKGGGIVPVVSIDGWLRMMNDHPQFDGLDYEWQHEGEKLIACTAVIYRKDRSKPVRVTEYLSECKRNTDPWKMEHRMLRHKATIQGARVAFGFSGITDEDEAMNTPGLAGSRDVTPASSSKIFSKKEEPKDIPPPTFLKEEIARLEAEESTKPLPEQIASQLEAAGIKWSAMLETTQANGEGGDSYYPLEEASQEVLNFILTNFAPLVELTKKGGAQ
jgi:phage recombination protein Bet